VGKWDSWTGQHDYSWGPGGIVFDSSGSTVLTPGLALRNNGVDRFCHEDWIGSARYLTDGTGNASPSALRYDSYGSLTAQSGPAHPTEFQFVGQLGYQAEYQDGSDPGLGIEYLQQRYYDPTVGRFLSRDPIGFLGGPNLYAYADNDPVGKTDPTGQFVEDSFTQNFTAALARGDIKAAAEFAEYTAQSGSIKGTAIFAGIVAQFLSNPTVQRTMQTAIASLPRLSYGLQDCLRYAQNITNALRGLGVSEKLEIMQIVPKYGNSLPLANPVAGNTFFANHFFVRYGNMVIDTLTQVNGKVRAIPIAEWEKFWLTYAGEKFTDLYKLIPYAGG
jgi:RHS repeat-associated protein